MRHACAALALVALVGLPAAAAAQDGNSGPVLVERDSERALNASDARRVREEVQHLLEQHPPNLRTVLQADPSLMNRADYLTAYPRLAEFLKKHPEVVRDPDFFIGRPDYYGRNETASQQASRRAYDTLQGVLAGFAALIGVVAVIVTLGAVVRGAISHRRWLRQSRVQTDVHTKILDRLQSNEDLLAYIQSPAGQRFLQTGPSPLRDAEPPRAVGAPYSRIFWSVQVGVVLLALGIGLWRVATGAPAEIAPAFNAMGIIATAVGVGSLVSGGISYVLSSRFGLLDRKAD
jgi:hypothetical protein